MSFLPAGEEDDSDWEDGFFGNEDFKERETRYSQVSSDADKGFALSPWTGQSADHHPSSSKISHDRHDTFGLKQQAVLPESQAASKPSPHSLSNGDDSGLWSYRDRTSLTVEDLQRAVIRGNVNLIQRCIDQGIPVDKPLKSKWTALMFASNRGRPEIVQFLIQLGASPTYQCDMYSTLMAACSASSENGEGVGECVRILLEAGAIADEKDRQHTTPLMIASREGHVLAVKHLVKYGAQVNRQDYRGWTALTWATQRQHRAVIVELLDSGADCNIRHKDMLTVKDLAAHLRTDEMLALLERRPANINQGVDTFLAPAKRRDAAPHSLLDSGDSETKCTDQRYGEMELFLTGLDLPHLVGVFQQQLIDLTLLLTLTEQDLINAGVEQIGARKKILDAVQAVHKKPWEPSSLVSIHFNQKITCADAVAMVANSSKHLRYIGSTIVYVKEQLRRDADCVLQSTDRVSPTQLLKHVEDGIKNTTTLRTQLHLLQHDLKKEMKKRSCKPPDLIDRPQEKSIFSLRTAGVLGCVLAASSLITVVLLYNRDEVRDFLPLRVISILQRIR